MAQLAFVGHPTRSNEIITLLEMLGGYNTFKHVGYNFNAIYYIDDKKIITCSETKKLCDYIIFTLEEFLEKYPYKVGDKVKNAKINDFIGRIINIRWDCNKNQIIYKVEWNDVIKSTLNYFARNLQLYKEKTLQENIDESFNKTNQVIFETKVHCCDIKKSIIDKEEKIMEKASNCQMKK